MGCNNDHGPRMASDCASPSGSASAVMGGRPMGKEASHTPLASDCASPTAQASAVIGGRTSGNESSNKALERASASQSQPASASIADQRSPHESPDAPMTRDCASQVRPASAVIGGPGVAPESNAVPPYAAHVTLPPPMGALPQALEEDEDMWVSLRQKRPAVSPQQLLDIQLQRDWRPKSGAAAKEFAFASAAMEINERLWDFYHQIAHAGWRVDCLYDNTPWKTQVNAHAGYGTNAVPAVRILGGPTLNWHVTTDGRIHMGGKQKKVDAALPAMRRAFVEYIPGQTEHTKYTGRTADKSKVQMGRKSPEDAAKEERAKKIRGMELVLKKGAAIFTKDGQGGLWDILQKAVGVRNVPTYNSMPWTMVLRTGVVVAAYVDGRVSVTSTKSYVSDIEFVEALVCDKLGAEWRKVVTGGDKEIRVTFGTQGPHVCLRQQSSFR